MLVRYIEQSEAKVTDIFTKQDPNYICNLITVLYKQENAKSIIFLSVRLSSSTSVIETFILVYHFRNVGLPITKVMFKSCIMCV